MLEVLAKTRPLPKKGETSFSAIQNIANSRDKQVAERDEDGNVVKGEDGKTIWVMKSPINAWEIGKVEAEDEEFTKKSKKRSLFKEEDEEQSAEKEELTDDDKESVKTEKKSKIPAAQVDETTSEDEAVELPKKKKVKVKAEKEVKSAAVKEEKVKLEKVKGDVKVETVAKPRAKTGRKAPNDSATLYDVGFEMTSENDGNTYVIKEDKNGRPSWKKVA